MKRKKFLLGSLIVASFFFISHLDHFIINSWSSQTLSMSSKTFVLTSEQKEFQNQWDDFKWGGLPELKEIRLNPGSSPAPDWLQNLKAPFQISSQQSSAKHALNVLMMIHDEPDKFHIIVQYNLVELPSENFVEEKTTSYYIEKNKTHQKLPKKSP